MRFNSRLLRDCVTPEQKKERQEFLASHVPMLQLLLSILESDINEARNSHTVEEYSSPSWAYKQADHIGTVRAYTHMCEILKVKED